ncbi:MAG TPA: extracellular solute-binding protein [Candidatus Binatia bacterium]|jgi:iron(III) transport system substrate-binding protein
MKRLPTSVFWFVLLLSVGAIVHAQNDAESILARVNALPPKERTDALIAGARAENVLEWYGSLQVADVRDLIDKFKKKYPFIDVRYTRGGGTNVVSRVLTERKAAADRADVIGGRSNFHDTLMKGGLVAKNMAPLRKEIRAGFMDSRGYFLGPFTYSFVLGYNARLVPAAQAPLSYQDLLAPAWKGQMALDYEAYDWFAGILDVMGEKKGLDLARGLARQDVRLQRGHTLLTQLMAAGEFKITVDGYHYQLRSFNDKGAPVDYIVPDPMILKEPSGIWILKRAPHPHAAALMIDFLFSREGQQVYADQNRLVARKDMEWDFGGKKLGKVHVLSAEQWGPKYDSVVKRFDEIFRKTQ